MAATWLKLASALGFASALCSLIPSCADNNQTIFIRQVQALRSPECIVNSDPTSLVSPVGYVDVGVATSFTISPLVGNQLQARGDARQSKTETNRVQIQGAEVELITPTGAAVDLGGAASSYTVIASGTVDPASGADATYGVTSVEILPPAVLAGVRRSLAAVGIGASRTIHAKMRIYGTTLGNTEVETGIFTYPITACYGCSIAVPADAIDPLISPRNCLGEVEGNAGADSACIIGQDERTDCRACQGAIPLCTPCSSDADCSNMRSTNDPLVAARCASAGFCE
jgi:hypothetical protein